MNSFFYPKLALTNIKRNAKTYVPYLLTCIGTIIMFYNMAFLATAKDIGNLSDSNSLRTILVMGAIVIGIFSSIFLFYTNSFLIKRRKKEFGLFNILGMEKKHIARVMFFETLFIALISIIVGLLAGILFSKLMLLLLFKIVSFYAPFGYEIPMLAVLATLILFCGIFTLNLFYNFFQVHLSKPVELLKGGNVGEKEPKTKWILATVGTLCLGIGYFIALTTDSPLAALNIFFIAVLLVIIGTYCLFTAGSVAVLKMLRRNKRYYYQSKHFISVSGMLYRMKQNAAGLANICILSTAVIIMISTTVSLYIGMEDVLRTRYPRHIIVTATNVSDEQASQLDATIESRTAKVNLSQVNVMRFRSMGVAAIQNGASFTPSNSSSYSSSHIAMLVFITLDDFKNLTHNGNQRLPVGPENLETRDARYNKMEAESVSLAKGEVLLYTLRGDIPEDTIDLNGFKLSIKERLPAFKTDGEMSAKLTNGYYIVVDNISTIKQVYRALEGQGEMEELSYYYGFDISEGRDAQINLVKALQNDIKNKGISGYAEGPENSRESFLSLYGGLFFLGIFLGLLFIMATVLIIYYKQIAEGYDDKERFEIMQKVGMSHGEVKKSIRSQVLTVFFLPLIAAVIHLAFAFKVITKLLAIFNMTNVPLFALFTVLTILVFTVFYAAIYALTARTYYRIVS